MSYHCFSNATREIRIFPLFYKNNCISWNFDIFVLTTLKTYGLNVGNIYTASYELIEWYASVLVMIDMRNQFVICANGVNSCSQECVFLIGWT